MEYTMDDYHDDGIHDGENVKWMRLCVKCETIVENAIDSIIDSHFE